MDSIFNDEHSVAYITKNRQHKSNHVYDRMPYCNDFKQEKMNPKKHIICYSGGHSSAIVAIEVARKFGKENTILLNHNINPRFEDEDIKRFKREVSEYLGIPITYANCDNELSQEKIRNQFEVCIDRGSFVNPANRQILCTFVLKTEPFYKYLESVSKKFDYIIYYGFDEDEFSRVDRRKTILNDAGYDSDYPIALWGDGKFQKL